ncbi:MAG: hypothetical protein JWQ94_4362 [Tardiphaga sp.]|nr:hypothetical protein [Tardiphaga sp.]
MKTATAPAIAVEALDGGAAIGSLLQRVQSIGCPALRQAAAILVLAVWQSALLFALFDNVIDLAIYVSVHLSVCAVLAGLTLWLAVASAEQRSVALQALAWSAAAGPFGTFVAFALSWDAAAVRPRLGEDVDAVMLDSPEDEQAITMHSSLLDRRLRIQGACRIKPLLDVISEGAQPEKLEALGVVYRKYEAELNPVLKLALRDPDTSVRVLAATVTAKLHATYSKNIGDLQAAAEAEPALVENWQGLAKARIAYAESGLLESSRARAQLDAAAGHLSQVKTPDPATAALAGRIDHARRQLAGSGK